MTPLRRLAEALVLAGLFFLAFGLPGGRPGIGWWEPLLAFAFPALLLEAAFRGRHPGWLFLACFAGLAAIFAFVPATLAAKAPMPYLAGLGAALLFWGYEAAGFLGVALLARWAHRRHGPMGAGLAAAAGLLLWEGLLFHVYPWSWGAPFGALPFLARSAAFLGSPGLGAWTWGLAAFVASALASERPLAQGLGAAAAWLLLPALLGLAWYALPQGPSRHLDLVMVQPDFDPGLRRAGMEEDQWALTDAALRQNGWPRAGRRTLVLWAESAVLGRNDALPDARLAQEARRRGVAWLYGTEGAPPGSPFLLWNLVRGEADGRPAFLQAKVEPMAFGERMPGPAYLRRHLERLLGSLSQEPGHLGPASSFHLATPEGDLAIHPLICSEALLPRRVSRGLALAGGDLLTNHTNDGWFERSAATDLHAAQVRLRAAETGLPVLRATLTGRSGLFRADGTWELWGTPRSAGVWAFPLDWRARRTPARWPGLPWALLGGLGLISLVTLRGKQRSGEHP